MSSTCGVCNQASARDRGEAVIKCSGTCGGLFHSRCLKDDEAKRTRSGRDWKCKDCRTLSPTASSVNSSSSSNLTKDFLVRVIDEFKSQVFNELKVFRKDVSDLSTSVGFLSDKMDESTLVMQDVLNELAKIKKENDELRAANNKMANELRETRDRVRSLEQYTRRNNVEISGIPVSPSENVVDIVRDVGATLGVDILESQLSAAHRIPSYKKERAPSIVVQFINRATKEELIKRFREKKTVSANQVNSAFPNRNIYVNEHLSPDNKVFLAKLKQKCREVGYTYVWCRDGKFFVRRASGESVKRIYSYEDFNMLK